MRTLTKQAEFLDAVQPFLASSNPVEAMKQAGFTLTGELGQLTDAGPSIPVADARLIEHLRSTYGPPPPARVAFRQVRPIVPIGSGYRATVSAELGLLNEVLAELWRVQTIPNEFSQNQTRDHLITVTELRALCDGVPADATEATFRITTPPIASTTNMSPGTIHVDIGFQVALNSATSASLVGVIGAEVPLDLEVRSLPRDINDPNGPLLPRIRLTVGAIQGLTAAVTVGPGSSVQPKAGGLAPFNHKCAVALQGALLYLIYEKQKLLIPAQIGLGSTFPNSQVAVSQAGAVTVSAGGRDFAIAGINVGAVHPVDPSALVTGELPAGSTNVHGAIDQSFATDVLSAAIDSGDMAAFFNRIVERSSPVRLAPIVVAGGTVLFDTDSVEVDIDCVWQGACNFNTDLSFTAKVSGTPTITDGRMTIQTSGIEFDVSTWDEIKCVVLAIPVLGTVITLGVEAVLELYASFSMGQELHYTVGTASRPLPGSEKVVQIELTQAVVSPGTLRIEGQANLIDDTLRTFVYLRLQEGPTRMLASPLAGASVELVEVHDFAQTPSTGETDTFKGKFEIFTVTSYEPLPDDSLAIAPTDNAGNVRFAVVCPAGAGILTTTTTTTTIRTNQTSTTTKQEVISQGWTDLAITVTDAGGTVLTTRQMVGTNIVNKRLGSAHKPVVVLLGTRMGAAL
jgi:hypothetical protein